MPAVLYFLAKFIQYFYRWAFISRQFLLRCQIRGERTRGRGVGEPEVRPPAAGMGCGQSKGVSVDQEPRGGEPAVGSAAGAVAGAAVGASADEPAAEPSAATQAADAAHKALLATAAERAAKRAAAAAAPPGSVVIAGTLHWWDGRGWVPRACTLSRPPGDLALLELRMAETARSRRLNGGDGAAEQPPIRLLPGVATVQTGRCAFTDEQWPHALSLCEYGDGGDAEPTVLAAKYEATILEWSNLLAANLEGGLAAGNAPVPEATPKKAADDSDASSPRAPSPVGAVEATARPGSPPASVPSEAAGSPAASRQAEVPMATKEPPLLVAGDSVAETVAETLEGGPASPRTAAQRLEGYQQQIAQMGGLPSAGNADWQQPQFIARRKFPGETDSVRAPPSICQSVTPLALVATANCSPTFASWARRMTRTQTTRTAVTCARRATGISRLSWPRRLHRDRSVSRQLPLLIDHCP